MLGESYIFDSSTTSSSSLNKSHNLFPTSVQPDSIYTELFQNNDFDLTSESTLRMLPYTYVCYIFVKKSSDWPRVDEIILKGTLLSPEIFSAQTPSDGSILIVREIGHYRLVQKLLLKHCFLG